MDWKFVVVFLVLLWPALLLLRVFAVTKVLLGVRLGGARVDQLPPPTIPRYLLAAAAEETKRLVQLGFQLKQGLRISSASGPGLDTLLLDFSHPNESIRAIVRPHASAERSGECWISFLTLRVDGPSIVTAAHAETEVGEDHRDLDAEVMFGAETLVVLNRHRERVAAAVQAGAWLVDANKRAVALHHVWRLDSEVERLEGAGEVTRAEDGSVSWKLLPSLRAAARLQWAERRRVKAAGAALKKVSTALIPPEALNEFDWRHYLAQRTLLASRMSGLAKTLIGVLSLIATAAAFAWLWSPTAAAALIVALFVHEFGHVLGMWMFGHRDTQMLFLPFLGAVAVAHDERVLAPWKQMVISFLGPLPGLFLGMAALFFGGNMPWVREAAWVFVVLNALNLAPVLPLDGGRVLDAALANRYPRLRIAFIILSALAMLPLGLLINPFLFVFAVAVLLRLPVEWRAAQMTTEIRAEGSEGVEEEPVVRRVLQRFREPEWARVPMVQRLTLARHLQVLLRQPAAGIGTIVLALAMYLSPFVVLAGLGVAKGAQLLMTEEADASAPADPKAPKFAYAPPQPTAEQLASNDNAAVPFTAALRAYESAWKRAAEEESPAKHREALAKEVLPLLRTAAAGKFFAVDPKSPPDGDLYWHQGTTVQQLVLEAENQFRAGETKRAQELIVDTIRLVRLLRTVPARWPDSADAQVQAALVGLLEEASARGELWDAQTRAWIGALFDETAYVGYARVARPIEKITLLAVYAASARKEASDSDAALEKMFWKMAGHAAVGSEASVAQEHRVAIATQQAIDAAVAGKWPAKPIEPPESNTDPKVTERYEIDEAAWESLQEFSATWTRVRLTRAALTVLEQRATTGRVPRDFASVQGPAWKGIPLHPRTGEPLQWSVREDRAVLEFVRAKPATASAKPSATPVDDEVDDAEAQHDEHLGGWRLPKF